MIRRRVSRPLQIGNVTVGGTSPVNVQSMTKTDTRDVVATLDQIRRLADCGCDIVRLAVPDMEAAEALGGIRKDSPIPLIADIHFDYRLALVAMNRSVDQVRFNPGNIEKPEHVVEIVKIARERKIPLRIGVNAGSLKHERSKSNLADKMAQAALDQVRLIEDLDFDLIEISLKASDVLTTIEANQIVAEKMAYPLHIGVTEAGLPRTGSIKSAVGLGTLLHMGIGDSLRVSLTTPDPCEEITAGFEILKALEIREHGPMMVSCPTCGRCEVIDGFYDLAEAVERYLLEKVEKTITVAVMGCVVNGPGEAKDADVGLACGKGKGIIFKKGEKIRTVEETEFFTALVAEIKNLNSQR